MNDFSLHYTAIMPSYICTLNCKLCIAGVPYYRTPKATPVNIVKDYIDRYFNIVTSVKKFTISGGEPLLYKSMPELLEYLGMYLDRIGLLEILTSGTVIPSDNLIKIVSSYGNKFRFMMDDYGKDLSKKAEDVHKILTDANITHEVRNYTHFDPHCGGWVDFGDLSVLKHTREEAKALYAKCTYPQKIHFALTIHDGKMFPCPPTRRCSEWGIVSDESEYIDLFDESKTVEQQREKITNILNGNFLHACQYCNGMCEDSKRFYPAEQLLPDEVKRIRNGAGY